MPNLLYNITITFYEGGGSFLGVSFEVWSVIGAIFIPLFLFFIGLFFDRIRRKNEARKQTKTLVNTLVFILESQVVTVEHQEDDLRRFTRAIYHQRNIPNARLSMRPMKISEVYQFDRKESAKLFIENMTGDKLSNFKKINQLFQDINYIEKNSDQIIKIYNDFVSDLFELKEKWNTSVKELLRIRNEV